MADDSLATDPIPPDPAAGQPVREKPEAASPKNLEELARRVGRRAKIGSEVAAASGKEQQAEPFQYWGSMANQEPEAASPKNLEELSQRTGRRTKAKQEVVSASDREQEAEAVQRWWLRYTVAGVVVFTLWVELGAIFTLLFFQGFKYRNFQLDDWVIGGVAGGVFLQTVWCLQNIAAHLFPEGADKMAKLPKTPLSKP